MPSKTEWTDESWPVVTGCTPCSIGCTNCYAARMAATRLKHHPRYAGLATISNGKARWTGKVMLNYDVLEQPLHWVKPRRVFVASMGDLFHEDVMIAFISKVFRRMLEARHHTFQVLTKRPRIMLDYIYSHLRGDTFEVYGFHYKWPPSNIWLGVSIENQAAADERIPLLLQTPAAVRFVSVEPILGGVNFEILPFTLPEHGDWPGTYNALTGEWWPAVGNYEEEYDNRIIELPKLDWVICGGESGPGARPMHPDWARSLRNQCQAAGVPYFFKAWGAWAPESHWKDFSMAQRNRKGAIFSFTGKRFPQDQRMYKVGKGTAGHLLDGRTWQEFPR